MVRGERAEGDDVVRMADQLRRVLADLKSRAQASAPATPSILDHYAASHDADAHEDADIGDSD